MKTLHKRITELTTYDDEQNDESTLVDFIVTPKHLEYFLKEYPESDWEWSNELSNGITEVGIILNNEKCLIAFIMKTAKN